MQAYEFINNLIPPLKLNDKAGMALAWMEEIRTDTLPVVDQGRFLGFIGDELIFEQNDVEQSIGGLPLESGACWVYTDKHIYDVLRVAAENQSNQVAVLDRENIYQGVITMEDAIAAFADSLSIQAQGGVLILSMNMTDYHLSEISRLVESENTKILSSFITSDPLDENKIKVTLKLDRVDLKHVRATLERFGYRIIDHYQEEQAVNDSGDRIGNLLRFLDI